MFRPFANGYRFAIGFPEPLPQQIGYFTASYVSKTPTDGKIVVEVRLDSVAKNWPELSSRDARFKNLVTPNVTLLANTSFTGDYYA